MNNKKLGTAWENEFCNILAKKGYWVHFISPNMAGAQPFDVIAVKGGIAYAYDCKTSAKHIFSIDRLEDNQVMAFEKWLKCGNTMPLIAIKYQNKMFLVPYGYLKASKRVDLDKREGQIIGD